MKASVIWKRPRHSVLERFSSLKTYLQVWIDLKYGLSPPHVSYQPGATSAVDKEREQEGLGWAYGLPRLLPQNTREWLVVGGHQGVSWQGPQCENPVPGQQCRESPHVGEGGRPTPRPGKPGTHLLRLQEVTHPEQME